MVEAAEYYDPMDVHVRLADGTDLTIAVSPTRETIKRLKRKIRQSVPEKAEHKYIRLIYQGRLLQDENENAATLSQYGIGKHTSASGCSKVLSSAPPPVYIHCSLSDYCSTRKPRPQQQSEEIQRHRPRLGFDRLLDSGFNEEEIRDIRQQFHRTHGSTSFDEEPTEQTMAIEEQWMESTGEILPDGLIQGSYKEMMWGLLLGFFLGILCIFWFRESVFTRRHQMGIVVGMLINISFGVLHVYH